MYVSRLRMGVSACSRMLARAPKKKGKSSKAAVDEGPTGTVSPIQDKLNGMYMKALEAKKRPRP